MIAPPKMGKSVMTGLRWRMSFKDVVICAALVWAYQYARSQVVGDVAGSAALDELTERLWERLMHTGHADMLKGHKKLFHFLFEKELRTYIAFLGDEKGERIEQAGRFLRGIGCDPERWQLGGGLV